MSEELNRAIPDSELLTEQEVSEITTRLGSLALSESSVLAVHQRDAFDDIVQFYKEGGRETYVKLPTATGKTVLFVELSNEFIKATPEGEEKSRVIVLVPTIDIVKQTVGSIDENGKRRGFKGFAPDLDVRGLHGNISNKERNKNIDEADILITTYNTFRNLISIFGKNENIDPQTWEDEMTDLRGSIREWGINRKELVGERAEFLLNSFVNQEISGVKLHAGMMLREMVDGESPFKKERLGVLTELVGIASSEGNNHDILKVLKKTISKQFTPEMESVLISMNRMLKETIKEEQKEAGKKPGGEELFELQDEVVETSLKDLDEFEKFIVRFIFINRAGRNIQSSDLRNSTDRAKVYEYNDQIRFLRSKIEQAKGRIRAIENIKTTVAAVKRFKLVICDEAHRSIGTETWDAIRQYANTKDLAIIGFTATDEYFDRSLEDYFESKSHDLSMQEAMKRKIINPVSLFVHDTGLRFDNVRIDATGDYDGLSIRAMRFNEQRNSIGVGYAKTLAEEGYQGIMSAIAGDEGEHAKELVRLLNNTEMIDAKTGESRLVRARYILNSTPLELRSEYYREFERGQIDWLTFTDVIREGWDSDKAKAIINMRPTRSPLLATQRLGRIGRRFENAPVSIVIDLFDGIQSSDELYSEIPPVLATDVFNLDQVEQGHIVGGNNLEATPVISKLKEMMPNTIEAHYSRFVKLLGSSLKVDRRGVVDGNETRQYAKEWLTLNAIQNAYRGFMPKDIIMDAIHAEEPLVRVTAGRVGSGLVPLFNSYDIAKLHTDKPEINPWKLYIDNEGVNWISPEGCVRLLSKRFPTIDAVDVIGSIKQLEDSSSESFTKTVGRVRLNFTADSRATGLTYMYKLDEITERLVPYMLHN